MTDIKSYLHKTFLILAIITPQRSASISSTMSHRTMSASPLLYRMIDYTKQQSCYEIEPIYMSMYDQEHTMEYLMPQGKQILKFNQQGLGDINPAWLNLMSNNTFANYNSSVTFTPSLTQSGALLHWYKHFDNMFLELKTALVQCKSEIAINELGGGNGVNPGIMNAQQAFTQESWNYGKIGQAQHVVGLDDIEIRIGGVYKATSDASSYDLTCSGFGIIQAPTGTGTQAQWLFEPQVGTNHWNLGLGFETLISSGDDLKLMIAGNYRYAIPAWEIRSFDLINCGAWSRYLGIQDTYGLPTAPATLSLPGINYMTQQAYINGKSQLNLYARLQKQFQHSYFELSYNFLCMQQETIGAIKTMQDGFGIYAMTGATTGAGGVTTAYQATINANTNHLDPLGQPQTLSIQDFDKQSACTSTYVSNNLTARLEIQNNHAIYGFGASIDAGLTESALSTWSVWAQFGLLFGESYEHDTLDHEEHYALYNYDIADQNIDNPKKQNIDIISLSNKPMQEIGQEFMQHFDDFQNDFTYQEEPELEDLVDIYPTISLEPVEELFDHEPELLEDQHEQEFLLEKLQNIADELPNHHELDTLTEDEQFIDALAQNQTIELNNYQNDIDREQGLLLENLDNFNDDISTQENKDVQDLNSSTDLSDNIMNQYYAQNSTISLESMRDQLEQPAHLELATPSIQINEDTENFNQSQQNNDDVVIQKIITHINTTPMTDDEIQDFLAINQIDEHDIFMTDDEILAKLAYTI